jgi:subtilisin family serine protease
VHAYVIDTGIEVSHPDFGGRATNGWDFVSGDAVAEDCNGHGTHVSGTIGGTIYGVAKQVALVAVRVLNCAGSGTYSGVIAGIDWVAANHVGPSVANMSLGGGKSFSLNDAVNGAVASGVTFAVAAGNSAADACDYSPASAASALTVGATTSSDARASYSNYGSCLDLFAPGSGITSDWKGGGTNTISGTSMATPHVTGAAALYLGAHPSASPNTVGSALLSDAVSGTVSSPGSGSPNELLHVVVGTASTPPPSGGGNTAPTATITSKSCNGTTCSFAGSASDPDAGDSVTLAWDLGNGTTASGTSATATYGAGKYTVSLTATDSQGATGTATTSVNCVAKGKSKYISCN